MVIFITPGSTVSPRDIAFHEDLPAPSALDERSSILSAQEVNIG